MRRDGHKQQQQQQQQTSEHKQLSFLLLLPYLAQSSVPRHTTHSSTAGKLRHALRMCPHALNTKRTSCARAVVKCEAQRHSAKLDSAWHDSTSTSAWLDSCSCLCLTALVGSWLRSVAHRLSPESVACREQRAHTRNERAKVPLAGRDASPSRVQ